MSICILSPSVFFFICEQGTSIGVFGNYGIDRPQSTYVLDNASPVTFTAPNSTTQVYRQLFYQSPTLQDGGHSLVITFAGPPNAWFWLDYLQHTPSKIAAVASTSVANAASATASGGTSASRSNGGAIAGGVVGGVAVFVIVALGFFLLGRRRTRRSLKISHGACSQLYYACPPHLTLTSCEDLHDDDSLEDPPVAITPFTAIASESAPTMMALPFGSKHLVTSSMGTPSLQSLQNPDVHSQRAGEPLSSQSGDGIPTGPHLRYDLSMDAPPVYTNERHARN